MLCVVRPCSLFSVFFFYESKNSKIQWLTRQTFEEVVLIFNLHSRQPLCTTTKTRVHCVKLAKALRTVNRVKSGKSFNLWPMGFRNGLCGRNNCLPTHFNNQQQSTSVMDYFLISENFTVQHCQDVAFDLSHLALILLSLYVNGTRVAHAVYYKSFEKANINVT